MHLAAERCALRADPSQERSLLHKALPRLGPGSSFDMTRSQQSTCFNPGRINPAPHLAIYPHSVLLGRGPHRIALKTSRDNRQLLQLGSAPLGPFFLSAAKQEFADHSPPCFSLHNWRESNNQHAQDTVPSTPWSAEGGGFPLPEGPEGACCQQKSRCTPVTWNPSHLCWLSQHPFPIPLPRRSLMFKHVEVMI